MSISMNFALMNENTITPKSMIKAIITFSVTLFGKKSPKPIVERVVRPKYHTLIKDLASSPEPSSIWNP